MDFNLVEGEGYVAEFEATGDFNLHLERKTNGSLVVSQSGVQGGSYDTAFVKGMYEGGQIIDYGFGALVYPKYIKVVSSSEVVSGTVTFAQ